MGHNKFELFMQYRFFIKTRSFIKNTYQKYILWYDYWNEKRLDDRRDRQNKRFRLTEQNATKLIDLNKYLSKLMTEVYMDCAKLRIQLDKWIEEGKTCYKNYEIVGSIVCIRPDYDVLSRRQANLSDAQDYVTDNTAWCVRISDKEFCKTELSKDVQFKNGRLWDYGITLTLKNFGIEKPCAYVDALLNINHGFSLKDFVKMTEENFCKNIEVKYES